MTLDVQTFPIDGPLLVTSPRFGDHRGWFTESWNKNRFEAVGIDVDFVQDNHSFSKDRGTLRGLHCQAPPHAQDKLVQCTRGAVFDVVVDVRRSSQTYGKWLGVELKAEDARQLFIPKGFMHGFVTRSDDVEIQYKCSDVYAAQTELTVLWNSLDIDWNLDKDPTLSAKDHEGVLFSAFTSPFE